MNMDYGISLYFRHNRIRFRNQLIHDLGNPDYIHLFIDTKKRCAFIQVCDKDPDAFKLYYKDGPGDQNFYIRAKILLEFLAKIVKVDDLSNSVRLAGSIVDKNTALISLKEYEVISSD